MWGDYVIEVSLTKGSKLLTVNDAIDSKTINSLKKEFGKDILSYNFTKSIPHNKQLLKHEVITLYQYLHKKMQKHDKRYNNITQWYLHLGKIYHQIKKLGYHGISHDDPEWPETIIFDPLRVKTVRYYRQKKKPQWLDLGFSEGELEEISDWDEIHKKAISEIIED